MLLVIYGSSFINSSPQPTTDCTGSMLQVKGIEFEVWKKTVKNSDLVYGLNDTVLLPNKDVPGDDNFPVFRPVSSRRLKYLFSLIPSGINTFTVHYFTADDGSKIIEELKRKASDDNWVMRPIGDWHLIYLPLSTSNISVWRIDHVVENLFYKGRLSIETFRDKKYCKPWTKVMLEIDELKSHI